MEAHVMKLENNCVIVDEEYFNEIKKQSEFNQERINEIAEERFLEKFIMMEFVKGNLDSQEQVNDMVSLIQRKLGVSVENAREFLRKAVGLI